MERRPTQKGVKTSSLHIISSPLTLKSLSLDVIERGTVIFVSKSQISREENMIVCVLYRAGSRPLRQSSSYPITGLDRPSGLQEVQTPRISRQSAREGGNVVSPRHRPHLPPREDPWY